MRLAQLCEGIPIERIDGDPTTEIGDLAFDSRRVAPGSLFLCAAGENVDGHDFAPAARDAGAAALVVERPLGLGLPEVLTQDVRAVMAPIASRFFGAPSSVLAVAAVTGTNGKTTTSFLVRAILEAVGRPCGLLGTVRQVVGGEQQDVVRTTPESIDLQRTLASMRSGGDVACAIEISSHGLQLGRVDCLQVEAAAFTNLTQDHLDFHADMEDYYAAKRLLFVGTAGRRPPRVSVLNVDDPYGVRLVGELNGVETRTLTFSAAGAEADLVARDVEFDAAGARFTLTAEGVSLPVALPLPGHFNVENALAALGLARGLGVPLESAVAALSEAEAVPGRMEPIREGQPFAVLVDYAHTPDSLENALTAARRLTAGRLISVIGCGGDRDRAKRPLMGRAGAALSDHTVITSDNPRSEDPATIIDEILSGIGNRQGVEVESDRRLAIGAALGRAEPGDLVLIAGKGHEQGQEFDGGRKIPFDDREVAREQLRTIGAAA